MSERTMDSATGDIKNQPIVKSNNSLSKNTKMFILPPNVLQDIHISDSMVGDARIISAVKLMKKDNAVSQENKNLQVEQMRSQINPTSDRDNVMLKGVTKVPKVKNEEKKSKISRIEQTRHSFPIVEKQETKEIDKSANFLISPRGLQKTKCIIDNVRNYRTTSNTIKSQETETKVEPNNSKVKLEEDLEEQKETKSKNKIDENTPGRSKRIRKHTKFDDFITSHKKESIKRESRTPDQKKKCTPTTEQKEVSPSTLSDTTEINNMTNSQFTKEMFQNTNNKESERAIDSRVTASVTPAINKSLPLDINNASADLFNAKDNESNFYAKDSSNAVSNIHTSENKDIVEINGESGNEKCLGSKSHLLEHTVTESKSLEVNSSLNVKEDLNDRNIDETWLNSADTKCIDNSTIKIEVASTPDPLKQENVNANSNSAHTDMPLVPPVRKRGRPRKYFIQQVPSTSNEAEKNSGTYDITTQKTNDITIAEAVVHNNRQGEKLYKTNNDGFSDDSTESNTSNLPIVRKRGRPPGSFKSTGRGRGRGRGKGRGSSNTVVDTEYVPKLKGPSTENTEQKSSTATYTPKLSNADSVTCAGCETEVPKKQWNAHNLLKHNNMGWRKGDEPMDFENDMKLWKRVLMNAIKKKKGQLSCEKCGIKKRSVNGFISHTQFCGKSDEEKRALLVRCPVCDAIMMPSSMEIHERVHRQTEQSKVKLQSFTPDNERVKRKAAEKAVTKILEFTELVRDSSSPPEKKTKFESSFLKNVIKTPAHTKKIPAIWKTIWKKELASQGTTTCRQIGCTYTCSSYEDIFKHFSECKFTPEECYICKICKFSTTSNKDIMEHVTEKHARSEEIDKYSDYEEESSSSDEKPTYTMKFLEKEQMYRIRWKEPYFPTIHWTMEFEEKNYELDLFNDYIPNPFTLLKNDDAAKYLPELEVSMRTKKQDVKSEKSSNTKISWKQWRRFEGGFDEGTATFFVGGPIWALAWLPIPAPMHAKEPSQYVAISTHPTMESKYAVGQSYSEANMIQIWNVGLLHYEIDGKGKAPALSYAIAHNAGTIWCLEWCPSGCYQDESLSNYKIENKTQSDHKRMGMLAAASADGNVHVYSLPFPEELKFEETEEHKWPIYHTDPIMTLVVNIQMYDNNNQKWQCTKLSWSKEHGHNTIVAGFSNGYIALWDLMYKSPLSIRKRRNTYFVNAFQYFYAHGNAVSMIALVPYNGARFLASGSLDRLFKFWDLEDTSHPQSCLQKGIIADGTWMTHWPCAVICFDDALGYKHTNSYIVPLREHEYKYFPILATNSPTYTVAVSDYANSIAHGTLAGEVITIFPHQLVYSKDLDKALQKKRKLSSSVQIVDFLENVKKETNNSNDYCYMPETYNECKDRFGVIFCNNLKNIERYAQQKTLHAEKLTAVPIEEYPFMSVNKVSWNPNVWSYLWLAVGYQNGFARLLHFKYMSVPRELKTLLPKHVESMLKKTKGTTEETC